MDVVANARVQVKVARPPAQTHRPRIPPSSSTGAETTHGPSASPLPSPYKTLSLINNTPFQVYARLLPPPTPNTNSPNTTHLHQRKWRHIDEVDEGPRPPCTSCLGVRGLQMVQHHRVHVDAEVVLDRVAQGTDQLHSGTRGGRCVYWGVGQQNRGAQRSPGGEGRQPKGANEADIEPRGEARVTKTDT
jgi:hypothetical protein